MTDPTPLPVPVTPTHSINVSNEIRQLLDRPQARDFVIRRLSAKMANGQPLIQGELIVSGWETLNQFPLANDYPIHFRKTYYPTCFHQNPKKEFDHHQRAAEILNIAPPIGWTKTTFRACFIPGTSYKKLSPFGVEPLSRNLSLGEDVPVPTLIGLWNLLERLYSQVKRLHENDLVHGDLFLHNVLVSNTPIAINLIDFELAKPKSEMTSEEEWDKARNQDCSEIWQHAIFLQCALGSQNGPLAEDSMAQLDRFFPDPEPVHRRLKLATPK